MKRNFATVCLISICFFIGACTLVESQSSKTTALPKRENNSQTDNNSQLNKNTLANSFDKLISENNKSVFFESVDERCKEAGIKTLRNTAVSENDFEIRVWVGFGLKKLEGFILNQVSGKWSATHIDTDFSSKKSINRDTKLAEPKSGWQNTLQKLIDNDILTLPSAESINCSPMYEDGMSYVVEIKKGNKYRTYMYDNPWADFENRCAEADKMLNVGKIIFDEFGLVEFDLTKRQK